MERKSDLDMTPASSRPATRCRLLELPTELREWIYEYAFQSWSGSNVVPILRDLPKGRRTQRPPGLVQACHQLRNETAAVYYGRFVFKAPDCQIATTWLITIPPSHATFIKHIRIVIAASCDSWNDIMSRFDAEVPEFENMAASCCAPGIEVDALFKTSPRLQGRR